MCEALLHDVDEVYTGDPPSSLGTVDLIRKINNISPTEAIVKMADLLEAAWFIKNNFMGIRAAGQAYKCRKTFIDTAKGIGNRDLGHASITVWENLNAL
jgi:5'-deoxynucleotidase YfbR-like HD superfamily hydrolase